MAFVGHIMSGFPTVVVVTKSLFPASFWSSIGLMSIKS